MKITADGRRYELLSESERWRVEIDNHHIEIRRLQRELKAMEGS